MIPTPFLLNLKKNMSNVHKKKTLTWETRMNDSDLHRLSSRNARKSLGPKVMSTKGNRSGGWEEAEVLGKDQHQLHSSDPEISQAGRISL
jgi:hypothetical protein